MICQQPVLAAETTAHGDGPPLHSGYLRSHKTLLTFSVSSIVLQAASLASGVIVLRWLPVAAVGAWQGVLLLQTYVGFIRVGVLNAANRELPFSLGQGNRLLATVIAETAQFFELGRAALEAAVYLAAAAAAAGWGYTRVGLLAMVIIGPVEIYLNYLLATFRSVTDFDRLSRLQVFHAALWLAAPPAVYVFGFPGLCCHYAARLGVMAMLVHRIRPFRVAPRRHYGVLLGLIRTGLPLFVTNYAWHVGLGFDRLIVLQRGGTEALGYYAPAAVAASAIALIPNSVSAFLYPQLSFRLGKGDSGRDVWVSAASAAALSALATVPLLALAWWSVPYVVDLWLPEYRRSVPALRITLLAGSVLSVTSVSTVLRCLKSWKPLFVFLAVFVASKWLCPWFMSSGGDLLAGVAYGSLFAACLSVAAAFLTCYCAVRTSKSAVAN